MSAIRRVMSVAAPMLAGMLLLHAGEKVWEAASESAAQRANLVLEQVVDAGESNSVGRLAGVGGIGPSGLRARQVEQ
jgi:hypothetical protein